MTTRKKPGAKKSPAKAKKRVARKPPARSGPIRTGSDLPKDQPRASQHSGHSGKPLGASPAVDHDEGMINKAVADAVRNANQVFSATVAQGRVAAEQFRHGDYNMRDVPVDVQILGNRMIKLARELSETTLNILEQLLKQMTEAPKLPPGTLKGTVPPFPTGENKGGEAPPSSSAPTGNGAPPSTHPGPPTADSRALELTVKFEGNPKAKMLPSPLWKPEKPTLPKQLSITPMMHITGGAAPIDDVTFEADLDGRLIATITIPARKAAGVYAGMIVPDNSDVPLGVLTIEIVK